MPVQDSFQLWLRYQNGQGIHPTPEDVAAHLLQVVEEWIVLKDDGGYFGMPATDLANFLNDYIGKTK